MLAIRIFPEGCDSHVADWGFELDQGVSAIVVNKLGKSLAIGAEISVMADGTLEAISSNVRFLVLAERTIAEDSDVVLVTTSFCRDWLVKRHEAVAWVVFVRFLDAGSAIIPVRAIHALMTHAVDVLS